MHMYVCMKYCRYINMLEFIAFNLRRILSGIVICEYMYIVKVRC